MENSKDALRILSINAWRVSGARFNAVRRLRKRDWFSTFSIALFSAIALGIAATQKIFVFPPGAQIDNYLTALSAFIGLFVLVISLIEAGEQSLVKAERLETNANDLRYFMYKVNFRLAASADGEPLTYAEIDRLRLTYQAIIRSCPDNHEPADDDLFVAKNRADPRWITIKLLSRLCEDNKTTSKPDNGKTKPKMTSIYAYWVQLISPLSGIVYFLVFWLVIVALITVTITPVLMESFTPNVRGAATKNLPESSQFLAGLKPRSSGRKECRTTACGPVVLVLITYQNLKRKTTSLENHY